MTVALETSSRDLFYSQKQETLPDLLQRSESGVARSN